MEELNPVYKGEAGRQSRLFAAGTLVCGRQGVWQHLSGLTSGSKKGPHVSMATGQCFPDHIHSGNWPVLMPFRGREEWVDSVVGISQYLVPLFHSGAHTNHENRGGARQFHVRVERA